MRFIRMLPNEHDALVAKLAVERKQKADAIRLINANVERGWKGVPAATRRRQEERLPTLREETLQLDTWITALANADGG